MRADRGPRRRLLPRPLPRAGAQLHRLVQRAPGDRRGRQRVRRRPLRRVGPARRLRVPRRDDPQRDGGARAVHQVLPRHRRPPDARLPRACHDLDQLLATLTSTVQPAARFAESVGKVVNATMANGCDLLDCAKLQAAKAAEALEAMPAPRTRRRAATRRARARPAKAARSPPPPPGRPPSHPPSLPASQVHGGDRRAHRHAVPRRGRGVVLERLDGRRRRRRHRHRRAARLVAAAAAELPRLEGRARRARPRDRRPARQRVLVRHRAPSRRGTRARRRTWRSTARR